jgi:hypothetical protein
MVPEAYCVKCKAKREIKDPVQTMMKNGTPATKGQCATCGTNIFRMGLGKKSGST